MKLIMFPLLFSVGFIAFQNRDKIIDQYTAAYPADPGKAAALTECINRNPNFNRLDSGDRAQCYQRYLAVTAPVPMPPVASPSYAYSPSHLAGNDVRRQEANAGYHPSAIISSAEAATVLPKPVAPPAVAGATPHRVAHSTAHPIYGAAHTVRHTTQTAQTQ